MATHEENKVVTRLLQSCSRQPCNNCVIETISTYITNDLVLLIILHEMNDHHVTYIIVQT